MLGRRRPSRATRPRSSPRTCGWSAVRRSRAGRASTHHPQVDFGASVPKRAADALFWLGRAAERAEVGARARSACVGGQVAAGPVAASAWAIGAWSQGALALLRAAQSRSIATDDDQLGALPLGRSAAPRAGRRRRRTVAAQIAALVQEATSVREYLSTTTGRVLGRLARIRADLLGADAAADDLDIVLVDLAALAGLSLESTVRGPAWRFLDLGRRLERALAVLRLDRGRHRHRLPTPLSFQPLAESVLSVEREPGRVPPPVPQRRRARRRGRPAGARRRQPAQPGVPARPAARAHGVARLARGQRPGPPRRASAR